VLNGISDRTETVQRERKAPMIASLLVLIVIVVPLLVLGLVALLRARPEDIPAVIGALARWGHK
jgi:hypothetical protein